MCVLARLQLHAMVRCPRRPTVSCTAVLRISLASAALLSLHRSCLGHKTIQHLVYRPTVPIVNSVIPRFTCKYLCYITHSHVSYHD
ncbi:hypothetical protein B0J17DRAFT_158535 [Rhizoctonia solani]|nr:hypothetical protein B0J17DRAFT_158535 [Rhizoctonia solani]